MKHLRQLFWPLFLLLALPVMGQDADLPHGHEGYHFVDRLDIKGLVDTTVHTDIKPYGREAIGEAFSRTDTSRLNVRERAWFDLMRLSVDDNFAATIQGKGILKYFFTNKRDLFSYQGEKVRLYANVVGHINGGFDLQQWDSSGTSQRLFNYRNTRGVQLRGSISDRLGFFTEMTENQVKLPLFARLNYDEQGALNGQTFVKIFDQGTPNTGFDYFNARGYITYKPSKMFRFKLGRDRMFLGNGIQSLLLSDIAAEHFFLNLNTRVWKLEYMNHFAVMTDFLRGKPDGYGTHPKKYAAFHTLNFKPWRQVSIGLFESVVYSPNLPGGVRGFELEYLNPIIFYRSVEQSLGSPDNSMLGLTWKVNGLKHLQHYGQFLLDDLNFRNRVNGVGYVGNKYGVQVGLKYIDAFKVMGLDLQAEYNWVRPFTYSHFNPTAAYGHYGQPLAYGYGANAKDISFVVRYQPFARWSGLLMVSSALRGLDFDGNNMGGNIFRPYTTNFQDYNNFVGQGTPYSIQQVYGRLSYRLLSLDAYADLEARVRKENEATSASIVGSLRILLPNQIYKY